MRIQLVAVFGALGLVSACQAPAPQPVTPEPVYTGKYGDTLVGQCREEDQPVTSAFPSTLPLCSDYCGPGTRYVSGSNVSSANVASVPVCLPYHENTDNRDPTGGQRNPTGGQTTAPNGV